MQKVNTNPIVTQKELEYWVLKALLVMDCTGMVENSIFLRKHQALEFSYEVHSRTFSKNIIWSDENLTFWPQPRLRQKEQKSSYRKAC